MKPSGVVARVGLIVWLLLGGGCGDPAGPVVTIEHGWVRQPAPGATVAAAYLEIVNEGKSDLRIDAASSPQFARVSMHSTSLSEGQMRMRPLAVIDVPRGESVRLEPGARHLMLAEPRVPIAGLSNVEITLFDNGAPLITVTLPLRDSAPAHEH